MEGLAVVVGWVGVGVGSDAFDDDEADDIVAGTLYPCV